MKNCYECNAEREHLSPRSRCEQCEHKRALANEKENDLLREVMVAAAEEIDEHWAAHCDAEGYGPVNLIRRLEQALAVSYPGYSKGEFARLANIKFAWEEWNSKTDWVQEAFNKNLLPVSLLGRHRADVLRQLCEPLLGWKVERIDEWEVRATSPKGEVWRIRYATKADGFYYFVWNLVQALSERS